MKQSVKDKRKKAVALKYAPPSDSAPRITAKGCEHLAEKIITIAHDNGIPVKADEDLTEILYQIDLFEEIPDSIYEAVAEIFAFIYSLKNSIE